MSITYQTNKSYQMLFHNNEFGTHNTSSKPDHLALETLLKANV